LDVLNDVREGRQIVAEGRLKPLRDELGLTRSAMAEMLNTTAFTYSSWEKHPETVLWPDTAGKVGRFYRNATEELMILKEQGILLKQLMPLHLASTQLAIPQEVLMGWYRDGHFSAVDLGLLGLWIYRRDIGLIAKGPHRKLRAVE